MDDGWTVLDALVLLAVGVLVGLLVATVSRNRPKSDQEQPQPEG